MKKSMNGMEIWSWICELPSHEDWSQPLTFQLASSAQSIQLRADRIIGSNSEVFISFSVHFVGFTDSDENKPIWISDTCPISDVNNPFLPLVLQLLHEIVSHAPNAHDSTCHCPCSQLQKVRPEPVAWVMDSHSPESFSRFFNLVFLTRLFWVCVFDAPSEVGSLYFRSVLAPNLDTFACMQAPPELRNFFLNVGIDVELRLVRSVSYMLVKWWILREIEARLGSLTNLPSKNLGFSYAVESHGLWVLKVYASVNSMQCVQFGGQCRQFLRVIDASESLLKYALAHQQLEALIQLEYSVEFHDNFVRVNARIDNLRIHVVKLGFKNNSDKIFMDEKHFPSRIRVWVGPEVGAGFVGGLSLGRSTDDTKRETEVQKTLKGSSRKSKVPRVKAMTKMSTRTKIKNWRWDQDVVGNAATFEASLCDTATGVEMASWQPHNGSGPSKIEFQSWYAGGGRLFTKSGGVIFSGEECGRGVAWRLSKDMQGSVLKWRVGGEIWLSYLPNNVNTSFYETRYIQWCDEVDVPLIPTSSGISGV